MQMDLPADVPRLIDIDGVGVLCDPCSDRQWPPHYDYLDHLLGAKLAGPTMVYAIANFSYPICAEVAAWYI